MDILLVRNVVNLTIMTILSFQDLKRKLINAYIVLLYMAGGAINAVFCNSIAEIGVLIFIGTIFLYFSYISDERLGYGDGMLILGMALWMGIGNILFIIFISMGCLLIYVSILYGFYFFSKNWNRNTNIKTIPEKEIDANEETDINRKTEIAFVPFLLVGLVASISLTN